MEHLVIILLVLIVSLLLVIAYNIVKVYVVLRTIYIELQYLTYTNLQK